MAYVKVEDRRKMEAEKLAAERKSKWDSLTLAQRWEAFLTFKFERGWMGLDEAFNEERFDRARSEFGLAYAVGKYGDEVLLSAEKQRFFTDLEKRIREAGQDKCRETVKRLASWYAGEMASQISSTTRNSSRGHFDIVCRGNAAGESFKFCENFLDSLDRFEKGDIYPEYHKS